MSASKTKCRTRDCTNVGREQLVHGTVPSDCQFVVMCDRCYTHYLDYHRGLDVSCPGKDYPGKDTRNLYE